MKRFLVGPLLSALAIFFLGFAVWGAPHHLPYKNIAELPNEAAVATSLGQLFPASGAYLIPHPAKGEAHMAEAMKQGPTAEVYIRKESLRAMDPALLARGFLQCLVISFTLTLVLGAFGNVLPTYGSRVRLCNGIALLVFLTHMTDAVWWHHPWGWTLTKGLYGFAEIVVAGLVLAKFAAKPTGALAGTKEFAYPN